MTIKNMREANAALLPYVPLVAQLTGKDTTLERVWPLMELLGNPQDRLRVIHIAGTSGKTSTAYYLSALLSATGKKVGLTVSPHVDSVTERIQVSGRPLSEAVFCRELGEFLEIVQKNGQAPSYFELLYAFALWIFDRRGVDYAVVETGMGGLYDATNIVTRPDKVCIITDIGLDHTHILGRDLASIAAQKIGIVHDANTVFTYQQLPEVMAVYQSWVGHHQATMEVVDQHQEEQVLQTDLSLMPDYQRRNWLLAYHAYSYLLKRDSLPHLTSQALQQTQSVLVPARMEVRQVNGKTLVMDGAHNAQKMSAFVTSFQHLYPGVKPAILVAVKTGKEHRELAPILAPIASQIIATTFKTTQDLPVKSMDPEKLARTFAALGVPTQVIAEQSAAVKALFAAPEPVVVMTGSFYLLSQIRNNEGLV